MEKEPYDFSKPEDQEKFEQLPQQEKDELIAEAHDTAINIQNKATEVFSRRSKFDTREGLESEDYTNAQKIIDTLEKPWENAVKTYELEKRDMEVLALTPENKIYFKGSYEFDEKLSKDTEKKTKILMEEFDISEALSQLPEVSKHDLMNFINTLTSGDLYDPGRINHTLHGQQSKKESIDPEEKIMDMPVFFTTGHPYWFSAGSSIVIVNPMNDRFLHYVRSLSDKSGNPEYELKNERNFQSRNTEQQKRILGDYVAVGYKDNEFGFTAEFVHNDDLSPKWLSIADWIVDTNEGRLYKVTESQESKSE